jgi:periplasmic protein TonB
MAAKQPAPPLQAPQAAIPDKAPEQAITAAPAEPPQPVAATATTTHRDVDPAASAQPPTDAVPADLPAAANATAAVVKAQPRYNENPPPRYPSVARRRNYQGTVVLDVFVETDGRVGDLRIAESSRYDLLDQAAMRAVTRWRFIPGRSNDQTVAMWVRVPIQFRLN